MLNENALRMICVVLVVTLAFIVNKVRTWKSKVDRKNVRLMQLYMELKFLYKNLSNSALVASSEIFCTELISSIREYYNLEEIIVIDSVKMGFPNSGINSLKREVYDLVRKSEAEVKRRLNDRNLITQYMEFHGKRYIFYIFNLIPDPESDAFIVCVENYPTLLTKNELLGLENNVNLLKTRLLSE